MLNNSGLQTLILIASRSFLSKLINVFMSAALVLFYPVSETAAQGGAVATEQVQGVVKDALGRPLAGVKLSLQASNGRIVGRTQSDVEGRFVFREVVPGTVAVLAEIADFQSATAIVTVRTGEGASTILTLASRQALEIQLAAQRFDRARNALSPKTGSSLYRFDQKDIAALPQGDNTPLNQLMLQAPGVVQGDFGALFIRGAMVQPQYRINGIIVPEGIGGFGQTFDTRFVDRIEFLTGALPSQYGYRTGGVIEIQTKDGLSGGGRVGIYGGSHGTINPSIELSGTKGSVNYYVTGNFMQNDLGILSPTPGRESIHNRTSQSKGFGHFSYLPNPATRVSLIMGSAVSKFQIPNNPGQTPSFPFDGIGFFPDLPSAKLDEKQREVNHYAILALQATAGTKLDYQVAFFSRYTSVLFQPDPIGDLIYNGVASRVFRGNFSSGVQGDGSYRLNDAHTVRMGFALSAERTESANTSSVFPADAMGNQLPGSPFTITDDHSKTGKLYGLYVQDEWRWSENLTLNYGFRADRMDAFVQAGQLSPRVGMVYKLGQKTTVHAGYSRYFTPPRLELVAPATLEKFQNTTNAPKNNQNSDVLPERMHYFDAGATHQLTPTLNLGLDAYYKYARHLGDYGQFGQSLVFSPFNWGQAKIYGLELTANYRKENLSAHLNFARAAAFGKGIISGQFNFDPDELAFINNQYVRLDHDQAYTASGGMSYLWSGTVYSVNFIYGSGLRRGFANTESLPPYTQVNLGLARSFFTSEFGKLDTRLSIINLFDHVYQIRDGSGIGVGAPQYAPRRALYFGLSKAF